MVKPEKKPDTHCRALKYAEKVSRLLDERHFYDLEQAFTDVDYPTFEDICVNKLGLSKNFATALWARITAPVPPTEHW